MKIIIQAVAIAFLVGAASAASANPPTSHHKTTTRDYDALGPQTRTPGPAHDERGWFYAPGESSPSMTTGGPVGGLGS